MTKAKNKSIKVSGKSQTILTVFVWMFFILLALRFKVVAELLSSVLPFTTTEIQDFTRDVSYIMLSAGVVWVGVVIAGAMPLIGAAFVIAGMVIFYRTAATYWNRQPENLDTKIKGFRL